MTQRQVITLVCDLCGHDEHETDGVETRRITVELDTAEAEVCSSCWTTTLAHFAFFATHGRTVPRTVRKPAKPWPGTTWRFTAHALVRIGERKLDPLEILPVLDDPTTVRPGRTSDSVIHERGPYKAVVIPERGVVITVAHKGESVDDLHAVG
jgi:hypothetical protein